MDKGESCKPQKKQCSVVVSKLEKCQEDETSQDGANLCAQGFSHLCVVEFFFFSREVLTWIAVSLIT